MRFKTAGTCSRFIDLEVEDHKIKSCQFHGGCQGNAAGMAKLVVGRDIDEVIETLTGIDCGGRGTSCPDQLAMALKRYKQREQ